MGPGWYSFEELWRWGCRFLLFFENSVKKSKKIPPSHFRPKTLTSSYFKSCDTVLAAILGVGGSTFPVFVNTGRLPRFGFGVGLVRAWGALPPPLLHRGGPRCGGAGPVGDVQHGAGPRRMPTGDPSRGGFLRGRHLIPVVPPCAPEGDGHFALGGNVGQN